MYSSAQLQKPVVGPSSGRSQLGEVFYHSDYPKMFHVKHFGRNIPALFHVKQKRHEEKCFT